MAVSEGRADLHCHTTASDGMFAPATVVRMAKEAGLSAIAITDHDTTSGVEEAIEEGGRSGLAVIPGVELSTIADGADIHILGYGMNIADKLWQERLSLQRLARDRRNVQILQRLNALGIAITMAEVDEVSRSGRTSVVHGADAKLKSTGRPHIAEVLVRKGIVPSMKEAFDRYLAAGAAAYVLQERIHPEEALGWIRDAGGVAVMAHPGLYGNDELVERLLRLGFDGIEASHSDHSMEDERRYGDLARKYNLIATGGSDFHGIREGVSFHGDLGARGVSAAIVPQLLQLRERG
ncbi:PHP domain-containing protein [Paenibacillus sp. HB172176]|uniref:PHP domain-containing protein n=1 Tax=Paenibacillus sp. HB172176 TaxID=2493690 RepID=UPI00143A64B5|nr:PHP domain-containing protein [Paenibacillus sp. HB172176]